MKAALTTPLLLLVASTACHSAVITTADGQGADSMVVAGGNSATNYGSNSALLIKNVSPTNDFTRKFYLRFDLSSISAPITDATINLTVADNNNGTAGVPSSFNVAVFGLKDSTAGQSWGESTITWNNAPGNINSGSSFDSGSTVSLGTLAITTSNVGGTVVSFSSQALLEFLLADTDDLVTIMFARTDSRVGENLAFLSKESGDGSGAAALSVTAVPEPGTSAILILAAGGAMMVRRRVRH